MSENTKAALEAAIREAAESQCAADTAKKHGDSLVGATGTKYQAAADLITGIAPAFPLVAANATLGGVGKFLEKYAGNSLWPTTELAVSAYSTAIEMNNTLREVHKYSGEPCGELKTFKIRFAECMPTYNKNDKNFKAAAKEKAIEMGLDQKGSILNPCFDPMTKAKAEAKVEKANTDKKARQEYKDLPAGAQIRVDLQAVINRVVGYLPALEDAAGIADVDLNPAHIKSLEKMKTRLSNALATMESESIWSDDFADYKSK